ncbi:SAM-dependent methyltransferase [Flavicella sp.]|uniref:class I SAM-dependent methyltransferase n=1 Tax=Flavicella sp. TaxID=2957742 RepID=UPI00261FFADB|nr:SAM-dependent methyltransferase [Flavicella sp.]MDG1804920.1 SAM-dependent methyltransferase [Flavicella sp.]MDG2279465.1 SAM-dependent methyltransferase [Flavicella sp.]
MSEFNTFSEVIQTSIAADDFVKITLSKPLRKNDGLRNIYVRLVLIKEELKMSFTYHYKTNDQVKNFGITEGTEELQNFLLTTFRTAVVFTLKEDLQVFVSKKKVVSFKKGAPSFTNKPPVTHDKPKEKRAEMGAYLRYLGVTDSDNNVIPKMADKFRQINKYLEIMEGLISNAKLPKQVQIVDMGSGKGYLTFALYDYLVVQRKMNVTVTGIELRKELVDYCNDVAEKCEFENLKFECKPIQEYENQKIDILIALHACDTATDDAITKGIIAKAGLIVCAPCCHKQVRQSLKGKEQEDPILKYGIFKERQFEMVTDTIRALILEKRHYQTKIFEFISNEHTRKNVMLVATKSTKDVDEKALNQKIKGIKDAYGIEEHYLETQIQ